MADLAQDPLSARKAFDALPTSLSPATPENIANLIKLKQAQVEAQTVLQNTQPGMMMVNPAFDDAQQKAMQAQDAFDAAYNGLGKDGQLAVTNFIAANATTEARFSKDLSEMPGVGDIAPGINEQSAPSLFQLAKLKDGVSAADQAIIEMNMTAQMAGQILDMPAYTAAMQAKEAAESKFRDTYNTLATNGQLADVQNYLDSNRLTFVQRVGRNAGLMGDGFIDFTKTTAADLVSLPGLAADGTNWLTGHRLYDGSKGQAMRDWAMGGINWLNTHDLMGNEVSGEIVANKTANETQAVGNISTTFTVVSVVASLPGLVRGGATLLAKGGALLEKAAPALSTTAKIAEAAPAAEIVIPTASATSKAAPAVATVEDAMIASLADARKAREAAAAAAADTKTSTTAFQAAAEDMPMAASTTTVERMKLGRVREIMNNVPVKGEKLPIDIRLDLLVRGDRLPQAERLLAETLKSKVSPAEFAAVRDSRVLAGTEAGRKFQTAIETSYNLQDSGKLSPTSMLSRTSERASNYFNYMASTPGYIASNPLYTSYMGMRAAGPQVLKALRDTVFLPVNTVLSFTPIPKLGGAAAFGRVARGATVVAADQLLTGGVIRNNVIAPVTTAVIDHAVKPALNEGFNLATTAATKVAQNALGLNLDIAQLAKDHPIMDAAVGFGALNLLFGSDSMVGKMGMIVGLAMLAWMLESALGPERTAFIGQSVTAAVTDGIKGDYKAAGNDLMGIFQPMSNGYDSMTSVGRQLAAQQDADWKRQLANPTPALVPTGP